jgi:hypothetical protein
VNAQTEYLNICSLVLEVQMYASSHCQCLCNQPVVDILCTGPYKGLASLEYITIAWTRTPSTCTQFIFALIFRNNSTSRLWSR